MDQDDDRNTCLARWQGQPSGQHDPTTLETCVDLDERDSLAREVIETNITPRAVGNADFVSVGPVRPAERAGPAAVPLWSQGASLPIQAPPTKLAGCRAGADVQRRAVRHAIAADLAEMPGRLARR